MEAAQAFAIKADEIVYILRYNTRSLYPEHVAMLNSAWSQFQSEMTHGLHVRNRTLKEYIDSQPDTETAVADYLEQRSREEAIKREEKKREKLMAFHASGVEGSKESKLNRVEVLLMIGKKIIEQENRNKIISLRRFSEKIEAEIKKGKFFYETSTGEKKELKSKFDSIRKSDEIKNLHKKHFNYN
jgi:hypothetical protein